MAKERFLISVVMPVYNTEQYLEESVESVLSQSVGFSENIQLILVNDASTDGSDAICRRYRERFPDNVVYLPLEENAGPGQARNIGMRHARGKYLNFLDSDDLWAQNALELGCAFLEEHPDVDLVACRSKYFDAVTGYYFMDYKFDHGSGVVDIRRNSSDLITRLGDLLIRAEQAKRHRFITDLRFCEDVHFSMQLLFDNCRYGLLKEAVHFYRIRKSPTSLCQTISGGRDRFFLLPGRLLQWALDEARRSQPKALPYVGSIILCYLYETLYERIPEWMTKDDVEAYRSVVRQLLAQVDDADFFDPHMCPQSRRKLALLQMKHGAAFTKAQEDGMSPFCRALAGMDRWAGGFVSLDSLKVCGSSVELWVRAFIPRDEDACTLALRGTDGTAVPSAVVPPKKQEDDYVVPKECVSRRAVFRFSAASGAIYRLVYETECGAFPVSFSCGWMFPMRLRDSGCCEQTWDDFYRIGNWEFSVRDGELGVRKMIARRERGV